MPAWPRKPDSKRRIVPHKRHRLLANAATDFPNDWPRARTTPQKTTHPAFAGELAASVPAVLVARRRCEADALPGRADCEDDRLCVLISPLFAVPASLARQLRPLPLG